MVALTTSTLNESFVEPSPYAWLRSCVPVPTTYSPACEPLYPFQEISENRTSRARGMTGSCTEAVERKYQICIEIWQVELESCVWRVSFHKYAYVHGNPVMMTDPTGMFGIGGGMIGIGINIGLQLSAPSIGDSIRGALQSLVTEYALNLEFDIAWAQDWSLSDSASTRSDNQWVVDAIQQGALDPWMGIVRLLGGDLSDDGEDDPANGGNAAAMAARPRPPVRLPATGMAAVRSVHSSNGELKSAFAQITPANIGKGTGTTAAARRYVRKLGKPNDDAGHAIGKELGGDGSVRGRNVFPQSPHFNRGLQRQIEADIKKDVLAGKQVFVRVVPKYHPGSTRPHQITYQVRTDGVTKLHPILNP